MAAAVTVAPLGAGDRDAARALLANGRASELLERSFTGTPECRSLAARREGVLAGVVLLGAIAGAASTGALLGIAVRPELRRRGIGASLLRAALALLDGDGVRLVVAELPDDEASRAAAALLAANGFVIEAVVPDYVRDGVALRIFRSRRR